ncbi:hypothetical protein [Crossiella cryophila]|uniref:Uncharacterized protein n=1 Tax=Crossiella cryophila TaxID=43355 RepID=A0A7W7C921_9PSEU|nr:hypothetical protein [Crossiella cryophila]MBB4675556.1 hypothetical protein [Crossiella cryophila]
MVEDELELLITVVVAAENESQARNACLGLVALGGGRIVEAGDCSDEEPGCWSVTISQPSDERAAASDAGALSRAVRTFVRGLGPDVSVPRVSCELPTAWTVLDDPDLVTQLVPGGERVLVEAWLGASPLLPQAPADEDPDEVIPEPEPVVLPDGPVQRLRLSVDVAADRRAGAEWQARAVASRITHDGELTDFTPCGPGVLGVEFDLGLVPGDTATALKDAMARIGEDNWSELEWDGEHAASYWSADPAPSAGVIALQLSAGPAGVPEVATSPTPR